MSQKRMDSDDEVDNRRSRRSKVADDEPEQPSKWTFDRSRAFFIVVVIVAIIGLIYMYGYDMSEFKISRKKDEWDVEAEIESLLQYQNQLLQSVR